ncbi:MAG TPA: ankyrin repeat domain-containing protein [Acidobacteriota bacterium]|nr:ankyrin repeat domain-containing protein [Acidobacteriota bacterium]
MRFAFVTVLALGIALFGLAQDPDIFRLIQDGQSAQVAALLDAHPLLVNATDRAGRTPLFAAVSAGNREMARLLLERGAPVRVGDHNLRAPIHAANWRGDPAMIDLLLDHGAVVDTRAIGGATPLIHASLSDNFAMCRHLIDRGADIHTQCNSLTTPLYFAVLNNNREYCDYLLQAGAEVDVPDFLDRTHLAIAVRDGNSALVQSLVANGSDPFRKDRHLGRSLLHLAAVEGHADVLEILLRAGLKPEEKDTSGATALDYARRYGHASAARLLRGQGADSGSPSSRDADGATSLAELKAREAEVIKLQNGSWAVSTRSALLVFGYSETGAAPPEKSLANGHLTAESLAAIAGRGRRVIYVDRDIHPPGRPFSLEGTNPFFSFQKDNPGLAFILNPAHDRFYARLDLKQAYFPRANEPLALDGLTVTALPSYGAHSATVLEIDGLTIVWLTGICDNYLVQRRDAGVIDRLMARGVRPDILLLGTPSGIGPEFAHGIREAFRETVRLQPKAVFAFGHEPLERKVRLQLSRKQADLAALRTAGNPGDRFIVRNEEAR